MSDRRLIVTDLDPADPAYGTLTTLNAQDVVGVPLPAVGIQPALPAVGTTPGQITYDLSTRTASLWDGTGWRPVAPSGLTHFPNDAQLQASTPGDGTYATADDTGNLYVRVQGAWRALFAESYPTLTALKASVVRDGSVGITVDEGVTALRAGGAWVPRGVIYIDTEANLLARTGDLNGQAGIALDTGRMYTYHEANDEWYGAPVRHYATEAALLADTPPDGVIAFADDTGHFYGRSNGAWARSNQPTITVGSADPTAPASGDVFYNTTDKAAKLYTGTAWVDITGVQPTNDARNHGHVIIGDANGKPSWGGKTWFEIDRDIRETIDSGYGLFVNLRGYESVRVELQYVGQSLGLWPDANHSAVWIANRIKQDGSSNDFKEVWSNGAKWVLGRGHGGCTFTLCKDPGRPNHFLFWCHGYHTSQLDEDANKADGDWWLWSGRGTWEWNGTSGNPQFRFTSSAGQHGRLFSTVYGQTE